MDILDADRIERRTSVPEHAQTAGKSEAATYIAQEVVERGRWPMALTDIAGETEWSRQHIRNTLNDYFRPARDQDGGGVVRGSDGEVAVRVPGDVEAESYLRGYIAGMRAERQG